jgi:RimJ/RimL family protein N-acetyltransferase
MFRNWASDPEVTKFLTWPVHGCIAVSETVIGSWIQEYEQDSYYQWMIVLKELGQPIGSISVVRQSDRVKEAEIGYCIGSSSDRNNQGICDAANYAILRSEWNHPKI